MSCTILTHHCETQATALREHKAPHRGHVNGVSKGWMLILPPKSQCTSIPALLLAPTTHSSLIHHHPCSLSSSPARSQHNCALQGCNIPEHLIPGASPGRSSDTSAKRGWIQSCPRTPSPPCASSQDSPLTVRCTQLPLWKVSYCWSSISTLHSYQPWSSERTCSMRRDALSCRLALPVGAENKTHQPQNPTSHTGCPNPTNTSLQGISQPAANTKIELPKAAAHCDGSTPACRPQPPEVPPATRGG